MSRERSIIPPAAKVHLLLEKTTVSWCGADAKVQKLMLTTGNPFECDCPVCLANLRAGNRPKVCKSIIFYRDRKKLLPSPAEMIAKISLVMVKLDATERLTEEEINLVIRTLKKERARYKTKQTIMR